MDIQPKLEGVVKIRFDLLKKGQIQMFLNNFICIISFEVLHCIVRPNLSP